MVDVTSPPITTIAKGFCVSLPTPVDKAAGIKPIMAISAVITTGRTLDITPSLIATFKCIFASRFFRNTLIKITPFCIHTPNKAIKPIPALILKLMPVICKANMPPIKAKGTFIIVNTASFTLPYVTNKIRNTASRQIGTTLAKVALALCWFSNSPFQLNL